MAQASMELSEQLKAKSIRGAKIEIIRANKAMQTVRTNVANGEVLSPMRGKLLMDTAIGQELRIDKAIETIMKEGILEPDDDVLLQLYDLSEEIRMLKLDLTEMFGDCLEESKQDEEKEKPEPEIRMPLFSHLPQQMEIPQFRGNADASRFYLWLNEWNDYVTECKLTDSTQHKVLLNTAVKDSAKIQICKTKSAKEAIEILKLTYGHPRAVLGACMEDIEKLGNCPYKASPQMRDWLLQVYSYLDRIDELCKKNTAIHNNLPSCNVNHLVMSRLPYQARDAIMDKLLTMAAEKEDIIYHDEFGTIKSFNKS